MTVYSVWFHNGTGSTRKYAVFSEVPRVSSSTGAVRVYSNIFLSHSVANGETWPFEVNTSYYAWCGTSQQRLAPGVKVSTGSYKPATLGSSSAAGSTWLLYHNAGTPALGAPSATASRGAIEIDTGTDFSASMNVAIGVAGVDEENRLKPLGTLSAPVNAKVNIAPIPKFYLAVASSAVGTAIEPSAVARHCAVIDFSIHPGIHGAIVRQDAQGRFTVQYGTFSG